MIRPADLRLCIVSPVLHALADSFGARAFSMDSPVAVELMMGVAAQESGSTNALRQIGGGPACGIYQIEPDTHMDVIRYLGPTSRFRLLQTVNSYLHGATDFNHQIVTNLEYQTAIARIRLWMSPEPLPSDVHDISALGAYYVKWYNRGGAATIDEFVANYRKFVLG